MNFFKDRFQRVTYTSENEKNIKNTNSGCKERVISTKADRPITYVKTRMPSDSAKLEPRIERTIPFLYSKAPITIPSSPVVKSKIRVSSILMKVRRNTEAISTVTPRKRLEKVAMAMGNVLNGLRISPITGKNIGAPWNSTVKAVNMAPLHSNLLRDHFFNLDFSFQGLSIKDLWHNFINRTLIIIGHLHRAINP